MSTTAENPDCATCGTTLQTVLYGMPTAEAADSGKYQIMGCTIMDDSPSEKCFCPECGMFIAQVPTPINGLTIPCMLSASDSLGLG